MYSKDLCLQSNTTYSALAYEAQFTLRQVSEDPHIHVDFKFVFELIILCKNFTIALFKDKTLLRFKNLAS
jgi:hypothetical protein